MIFAEVDVGSEDLKVPGSKHLGRRSPWCLCCIPMLYQDLQMTESPIKVQQTSAASCFKALEDLDGSIITAFQFGNQTCLLMLTKQMGMSSFDAF